LNTIGAATACCGKDQVRGDSCVLVVCVCSPARLACTHTHALCCIPHHCHCAAPIYMPQSVASPVMLVQVASVTAAPHTTRVACDTPTHCLHDNIWCQTVMCAHCFTMPLMVVLALLNAERPCPCLLPVLPAGCVKHKNTCCRPVGRCVTHAKTRVHVGAGVLKLGGVVVVQETSALAS